eukprot:m.53157 g.53157  ORF g.53157 m.53157 type:complete len:52 (+) comp7427_c0_seq1:684-839(+)
MLLIYTCDLPATLHNHVLAREQSHARARVFGLDRHMHHTKKQQYDMGCVPP